MGWCRLEIFFLCSWSSSPLLSSFILWTGDVEVRVVGEGIKGFRRGGLSSFLCRNKKRFWCVEREMRFSLVASLLANKVSLLMETGGGLGYLLFVLLMVVSSLGGQMKVLVQYKSRVRWLFLG